jgi:alkylated DNA repair protein (DNA oxidative demethylase)
LTTHLKVLGFDIHKEFLDTRAQQALLDALREVVQQAPLFQPTTPRGKPMSVRMTSAGRAGWVSDRQGYRYAARHPQGSDWPPIPEPVMAVWRALSGVARAPDSCLVNFYGEGARMGLHQDRDEASFDWPVVSISLGDDALFRMGGTARSDPTQSIWLRSGDVVVMGGAARLAHHGIDRIRFGSSPLLAQGGRLNLTLRVVT